MLRFLLPLLVASACLATGEQQTQISPRIETGTHSAAVRDIDTDASNTYLFSASDDKTARVWDLRTGKLLKILRPPIGEVALEGMLNAIAASPDGATIAAGGSPPAVGTGNYPIYIFGRDSGVISKTINDLPGYISHLAFSKDGRYLAAALRERHGIRIYKTDGYAEVGRDLDYGDDCWWVEFDSRGRLVTVSWDGYVRLYSPDFQLLRKQKSRHRERPYSARFSPDGKLIAVGFDDSMAVDVLAADDLSLRYTLQAPKHPGDLNVSMVVWSADGKRVCAGGASGQDKVAQLVCWPNTGTGPPKTYPVAGNTIMGLRALLDGSIALSSGDGSLQVVAANGAVKWRAVPDLMGMSGPDWPHVSADGSTVEDAVFVFTGAAWQYHRLNFSLADERLTIDGESQTGLQAPVQSGLAIARWAADYHPTLNGQTLPLDPHETSRSLAIAPDKASFVLGTDWSIRKFTSEGKDLGQKSVPGVAWGVNITGDGRFMVANLADGTIRWYSLETAKEVLALFVDRDLKRWVAWSPDGFFTFKNDGDSLIGYQINHGSGQAGEFVKVDQLREVFYRPDLITRILKPGGAEAVVEARNRVGDVAQVLAAGLPPEIQLLSRGNAEVSDMKPYLLQFRVNDAGGGKGRVVYRIDGTEIEGRDVDIAGTSGDTVSRYIPVGTGTHTLTVSAYSANGKVEGRSASIRITGIQPRGMPNLYVVSAGISHYSDASLNRGVRFAADDANLVAARFKDQEGKGLYKEVVAVPLPDSRATLNGIQAAVDQAAKSVRLGDTFVLYLAGHGIVEDGEYYFIPYEAGNNLADLQSKGLNRKAIQDLLKKIPTNQTVLILDTCHAGAVAEGWDDRSENGAIQKVATMSGRSVLAASNTDQIAMDGYSGHGVFTYALLEGLGAAGSDSRGEILISGLAEYVQLRVPKLTEEKWHVEQNPLWVSASKPFPIAHKPPN